MGLYVQSSAVGHAQNDFTASFLGNMADQAVKGRNDRIPALQGKARHCKVLFVDKLFKQGRLKKLFQNAAFGRGFQRQAIAGRFHAVYQPPAFARILQMHEFDTDGMAIGFFESLDNLTQGQPIRRC